jgi:K+-transporting ATPase ATPase C chain
MKQLKPALLLLVVFTIITGIIYPVLITGLAQLIFPVQANGSLIFRDGQIVGSTLIGQEFDQPQYFWGRPSATGDFPYNASASAGSNYSILNPALENRVRTRLAAFQDVDPGNSQPVPIDLVTASASGLDPDISIAAAYYQAARIAKARGLSLDQVKSLITQHAQGRLFGFLGEPTVNVLALNLALDKIQ